MKMLKMMDTYEDFKIYHKLFSRPSLFPLEEIWRDKKELNSIQIKQVFPKAPIAFQLICFTHAHRYDMYRYAKAFTWTYSIRNKLHILEGFTNSDSKHVFDLQLIRAPIMPNIIERNNRYVNCSSFGSAQYPKINAAYNWYLLGTLSSIY